MATLSDLDGGFGAEGGRHPFRQRRLGHEGT